MPLPKPRQGESRDDFISRCVPNENVQADSENNDQAVAICFSLWEQSRKMNTNDLLLDAIAGRQQKRTEFGYGILTADRHVRNMQECVGLDLCYRYGTVRGKNISFDDVLRKAARTLTYSNQDMLVLRKAAPDFELPKNTLMAFRHVLTTPRKDRDGDVLRTEGAEVDPRMLLLWQHVHTLPIGKMVAVAEHNKNKLVLVSAIVDLNELAHDAAVMVDNDMARFSHGFRALEFDELKEDEGEITGPGGFDVKRFEIMEESIVSVPSNLDAEVEERMLDLVEGGKLTSDLMKETGRTIRDRRAVRVQSGIDLKEGTEDEDVRGDRGGEAGEEERGQDTGCRCASEKADEETTGQADAEEAGREKVIEDKAAVKFESTPVSSSSQWDATAATRGLRQWAGVDGDDPDWAQYRRGFARVIGEGNKLGDFSFPHHRIEDGRLVVVRGAITAGIAAVNGGRGGANFESEDERRAVYNHLANHLRRDFQVEDGDIPPLRSAEPDIEKAGRVLSARNLKMLQDVHDDLLELDDREEMSRSGHALCKNCVNRLGEVLKAAGKYEDEEEEDKPKRSPETVSVRDAIAIVVSQSTPEQRAAVSNLFAIIESQDSQRQHVETYRALIGANQSD